MAAVVLWMQSQTAAQDHVGIPDVITARPLLLLLETWSGWPFYESQDGVSGVFTAALSLEWLREEWLFCPSSWVFCSVGQISHAAVAVLASALSCSEYFLICSEGSTALVSSVVLLLGILNHNMSHQLLCACVNNQTYEKKPVLMCSFTRVFSHTFMPGGKISYLKPWNGNTSKVVVTCFCKNSSIFCSFATFDNWLVYFGRREAIFFSIFVKNMFGVQCSPSNNVKLNFQHHYSSLQCHMILYKSF